jgi:hypothetical protein
VRCRRRRGESERELTRGLECELEPRRNKFSERANFCRFKSQSFSSNGFDGAAYDATHPICSSAASVVDWRGVPTLFRSRWWWTTTDTAAAAVPFPPRPPSTCRWSKRTPFLGTVASPRRFVVQGWGLTFTWTGSLGMLFCFSGFEL